MCNIINHLSAKNKLPIIYKTGWGFYWSCLLKRFEVKIFWYDINNKNVEQKGQLKLASSRISGKEEEEATAKFYVHIFLFFSTKSI